MGHQREGAPNNKSTEYALDVIELFDQSFNDKAKKLSELLH